MSRRDGRQEPRHSGQIDAPYRRHSSGRSPRRPLLAAATRGTASSAPRRRPRRCCRHQWRPPIDEVFPDAGGHHHASGAHPHPDRLGQGRQEVHQQDVSLPDLRHPALRTGAGQRGELEHAQRLPAQVAPGCRGLAGDETPGRGRSAHGVPVLLWRTSRGTPRDSSLLNGPNYLQPAAHSAGQDRAHAAPPARQA
jgi:hypothetical protein